MHVFRKNLVHLHNASFMCFFSIAVILDTLMPGALFGATALCLAQNERKPKPRIDVNLGVRQPNAIKCVYCCCTKQQRT